MNKQKKIIIGVVCAVVAVALVVAVLAISGVFSKDPGSSPSTTVNAQQNGESTNPADCNTTEGDSTEGSTAETTTIVPRYDPTKYVVQGVDDKNVLVVLDKDGKPIINDKNQINVVDRDNKGEIITEASGEPQTHWEQIDDKYVVKDKIYATDYEINVIEGWEAFGSGYIRKLDATKIGGVLMKCAAINHPDYASLSIDEYLTQHKAQLQKKYTSYEQKGCKIEVDEKEITITDKKIPATLYTEKVVNPNGGLTNYSQTIYFQLDGNKKYSFQLILADDEHYNANKDFDFVGYVNKNFIVK